MTDPPQAPSSLLAPRRLIISTVLVLLALVAAAAALGYWFRAPLEALASSFVSSLGGVGIALGFFLPDAFTVPLPADAVTLLGRAGGMSFAECVAWAWVGSILGGSTAYWIGLRLRTTRWVARAFEKDPRVQWTLERYGLLAVAVSAVTPLPYSIFCWAAGAARLDFWRFLLMSAVLRLARVAGYLYLVQLGLFGTA